MAKDWSNERDQFDDLKIRDIFSLFLMELMKIFLTSSEMQQQNMFGIFYRRHMKRERQRQVMEFEEGIQEIYEFRKSCKKFKK